MPVQNIAGKHGTKKSDISKIDEKNTHELDFANKRKNLVENKIEPIPLKTFSESKIKNTFKSLCCILSGRKQKLLDEMSPIKTRKELWSEIKVHIKKSKIYKAEAMFEMLVLNEESQFIINNMKTYLGPLSLFQILNYCVENKNDHKLSVDFNTEDLSISFCFEEEKFHEVGMVDSINRIHIDGLNLIECYPLLLIKNQSTKIGSINNKTIGADELLEFMPQFFENYDNLTNFLLSCGVDNQQTGTKILDIMTEQDKFSQRAYNLTSLFTHFMSQFPVKNGEATSGLRITQDMTVSFRF